MPSRPRHPCNFPGCPALTLARFCEQHTRIAEAQDRARRGSSTERGYGADWQKYRPVFFNEFPLCGSKPADAWPPPSGREASQCLLQGIATVATVIHHIAGHHGPHSPSFWERRNHQALCESCHNAETARARM